MRTSRILEAEVEADACLSFLREAEELRFPKRFLSHFALFEGIIADGVE